MNNSFCFILLLFLIANTVVAQKIVKTTGNAQIELTADKSRTQVNKEVLDLALINAIERAFGRVVIQGNSTYISNISSGESTKSNVIFNMIANTSVKGEVDEIIEVKYDDIKGSKKINNKLVEVIEIRCDVNIKAREIEEAKIEFECNTLVCPKPNCKTTSFKEKDDFYIFISSPHSGFITIYLDDSKNSYRLLPYKDMPPKFESGFPIKADKEYIFFSQELEHNYLDFDWIEDTYELYAETNQDFNRLFIIYSKEAINKPRLEEDLNKTDISTEEKKAGYSSPKALKSEDFQKWLNTVRSYKKEDMQVAIIDITITK